MTAESAQRIVVEYTRIVVDEDTEYVVFSEIIQLVTDQGPVNVEDVTVAMIQNVARLIVEQDTTVMDRTTGDRLEELYIFGLFVLGMVPEQLSMVSARLCRARHQRYISRLAEKARKYKLSHREPDRVHVTTPIGTP